jgi:hypothetical protein
MHKKGRAAEAVLPNPIYVYIFFPDHSQNCRIGYYEGAVEAWGNAQKLHGSVLCAANAASKVSGP